MSRDEAPSIGRRRFVRWLGLGGLAAALGSAFGPLGARDAASQAATPVTPSTPPATPPATMPGTPTTPPPPSDEAKALHGILLGRYGAHIAEADKALLLPAIEQSVQSGKALRARTLPNSVEPDVIFRAESPRRTAPTEPGR